MLVKDVRDDCMLLRTVTYGSGHFGQQYPLHISATHCIFYTSYEQQHLKVVTNIEILTPTFKNRYQIECHRDFDALYVLNTIIPI